MLKPPKLLLSAAGLLFITAIFSVSWRWAGNSPVRAPGSVSPAPTLSPSRGPVDPSFCGPLQIPLPPPPIDSPYGHHLYAATAKGRVHPLPVLAALAQLPPPASVPLNPAAVSPTTAPALPVRGTATAPPNPPVDPANPQPHRGEYNETAEEDVQTVVLLLEEYRRAFGAMPMGEQNDEIVRRLQGENPKGIAVLPKSHPNLSPDGELLDRWGTPYRFHPESAWLTTVRSAGPDREMWTHDDVLSELAMELSTANGPLLSND